MFCLDVNILVCSPCLHEKTPFLCDGSSGGQLVSQVCVRQRQNPLKMESTAALVQKKKIGAFSLGWHFHISLGQGTLTYGKRNHLLNEMARVCVCVCTCVCVGVKQKPASDKYFWWHHCVIVDIMVWDKESAGAPSIQLFYEPAIMSRSELWSCKQTASSASRSNKLSDCCVKKSSLLDWFSN